MNSHSLEGTTLLSPARSVREIMGLVLLALLPGVMASIAFFGAGVLLQIALAIAFALALEATMLALRGKPLQPFISDLSAPLAAVLFALFLPPLAPWWLAAIGMVAAIVIGKHLYGGLGHNLFNPAMVGVAVVVVCFPHEYSHWLPSAGLEHGFAAPGLLESARAIFSGQWSLPADTLAQATQIDPARTLASTSAMPAGIHAPSIFATMALNSGRWITAAYALGGLFLLWKKTIPWQTPAAVILATIACCLLFWQFDSTQSQSPFAPLFTGGLMLAAFFIATDPVSGCTTTRGRCVFGAGVAFFALVIQRWGTYPGAVAFAVLLMNCAAPYINATTTAGFVASRE